MSIGAAGVGRVLLAAGLALTLRGEGQEARRQSTGGVLPSEVQLAPGTEPRRTPEEKAAQALLEQLRAQKVDSRPLPPSRPEVTCAIRIIKPDMDVDPGIYKQVPPSEVASKIRVVGGSRCLGNDGVRGDHGSAVPVPSYIVETYQSLEVRELVKPPPAPVKR